jgi:Flp pilus assembly protein protease CpaA
MDTLSLSAMIGLVAGAVDVTPMIIQKLPRYSIIAAFLYFFFISIVIVNIDLPCVSWWLEGGLISLALMLPILIHVGATDRKPLPVIAANSVVIGTLIGIAGHFLK